MVEVKGVPYDDRTVLYANPRTGHGQFGGVLLTYSLKLEQELSLHVPSSLSWQIEVYNWVHFLKTMLISWNRSKIHFATDSFKQVFRPISTEDVGGFDPLLSYLFNLSTIPAVVKMMTKDIARFNHQVDVFTGQKDNARDFHSDGIATMDANGNACAMTHTINAEPYGSGLFVSGIALSNAAEVNRENIKALDSAYLTGPITSIVALNKDSNQVNLALSTVGSSLEPFSFQLASSILKQQVLPEDAVTSPMFFARSSQDRKEIGIFVKCEESTRVCLRENLIFNAFPKQDAVLESWVDRYVSIHSVSGLASSGIIGPGVPAVIARVGDSYHGAASSLANGGNFASVPSQTLTASA
jgi:hypothetical protein